MQNKDVGLFSKLQPFLAHTSLLTIYKSSIKPLLAYVYDL